jgi:multicomponent Na+:H+ antiporter subunit E
MWVALWGELSVANVVSAVLVVVLVSWLFAERSGTTYRVRVVGAVRALSFVGWSLVSSSFRVVMAVLAPSPRRIATSIQKVRLAESSSFIAAIVANAITLTPGTMSLEYDSATEVLSVHVLGEVDEHEFRRQVLHLERLVANAVGTR